MCWAIIGCLFPEEGCSNKKVPEYVEIRGPRTVNLENLKNTIA